jgi:imidazole glycerol phosphate synthase glutamine amidotransferase subunit
MIGIIDYGAGNLLSVKRALEYLGMSAKIITSREECCGIERMLLPGVGAFEAAIRKINERGLYSPVYEWLVQDKPFLGICLGMQLLFEESEESPGVKGLSIFKGKVSRFRSHKVPQIGWNQVSFVKESNMLKGIQNGAFFYFLHGYYSEPQDENLTLGKTHYSIHYTSAIEKGNIRAVQFHPEKSSTNGLTLLKNWVNLC